MFRLKCGTEMPRKWLEHPHHKSEGPQSPPQSGRLNSPTKAQFSTQNRGTKKARSKLKHTFAARYSIPLDKSMQVQLTHVHSKSGMNSAPQQEFTGDWRTSPVQTLGSPKAML